MRHSVSASAIVAIGIIGMSTVGCTSEQATDTNPLPVTTTATTATDNPAPAMSTTTAPASTTTTPSTTVEADTDAALFFTDLFSSNITKMERALSTAAPGSPAAWYATFQIGLESANRDAGMGGSPASSVREDGDTLQICVNDDCIPYADFQFTEGELASFTIDGIDITGRLGPAAQPVIAGPATLTVTSSYRTISSDTLLINFELATTDAVSVSYYSATYIDPTGRSVSVGQSYGQDELIAGARGLYALSFDRADPGGRLLLEIRNADFDLVGNFDVNIPLLAP